MLTAALPTTELLSVLDEEGWDEMFDSVLEGITRRQRRKIKAAALAPSTLSDASDDQNAAAEEEARAAVQAQKQAAAVVAKQQEQEEREALEERQEREQQQKREAAAAAVAAKAKSEASSESEEAALAKEMADMAALEAEISAVEKEHASLAAAEEEHNRSFDSVTLAEGRELPSQSSQAAAETNAARVAAALAAAVTPQRAETAAGLVWVTFGLGGKLGLSFEQFEDAASGSPELVIAAIAGTLLGCMLHVCSHALPLTVLPDHLQPAVRRQHTHSSGRGWC